MSRVAFAVLIFAAFVAGDTNIHFFTNVRNVHVSQTGAQNFAVLDQEIWDHSRRDLDDLRLYAGTDELPYFIQRRQPEQRNAEQSVKILQLGSTAAGTSFYIDAHELAQYNRIRMDLATKNFVTKANVDGMDDIHERQPTRLGTFTVYDFSREKLGQNFILRIPDSSFHYLHITLGREVAPEDVKGCSLEQNRQDAGAFAPLSISPARAENKHNTEISWSADAAVPVDRLTFESSAENFLREARVEDGRGSQLASGEISRIHMMRNGRLVNSEALSLDVPSARAKSFKVIIENGDDAPLPLTVHARSVERRIYFDPRGHSELLLYYGDLQAQAPSYDYARLATAEANAAAATLGDGMHNPDYTGRPDERPWSEKHPIVLWIALLLAIGALGIAAVSAIKRPS